MEDTYPIRLSHEHGKTYSSRKRCRWQPLDQVPCVITDSELACLETNLGYLADTSAVTTELKSEQIKINKLFEYDSSWSTKAASQA